MKIQEVKTVILEGLRPFADERGYKINKGRFRIISKGQNPLTTIYYIYNTWGFEIHLRPYVAVDFKVIHEICEKCGFGLNYCAFINLFLLEEIRKHGWHEDLRWQMQVAATDRLTLTDDRPWLEHLRKENPQAGNRIILTDNETWIKQCNNRLGALLPYAVDYINNLSDIEGIDRLYNSFPINYNNPNCVGFDYHCMVGLISAKLAHNPQYDKLKDIYTTIMRKEDFPEATRQSFFRLVDYLDTADL